MLFLWLSVRLWRSLLCSNSNLWLFYDYQLIIWVLDLPKWLCIRQKCLILFHSRFNRHRFVNNKNRSTYWTINYCLLSLRNLASTTHNSSSIYSRLNFVNPIYIILCLKWFTLKVDCIEGLRILNCYGWLPQPGARLCSQLHISIFCLLVICRW